MDLLLSCLLLVFFVVAVEFTAVGSLGDGIVGMFGGLFTHPDLLPWPKGVQEDDDQRLVNLAALRRWAGSCDAHGHPVPNAAPSPWEAVPSQAAPYEARNFGDTNAFWLAADIVDDVPAVAVSPVRRIR